MQQFQASSTKVEVNGQTVLSVINGMGAFKESARAILKKNGIDNPQPGSWYIQQAWLDSFKEICNKLGPRTLFQIGKSIPENADFPPNIHSIEEALASIDVAYHMNHRNGEIGYYRFEPDTDHSAKIIADNPYPCDFDKGIVQAMAWRFAPKGIVASVDHEGKGCRKNGDPQCIYIIRW